MENKIARLEFQMPTYCGECPLVMVVSAMLKDLNLCGKQTPCVEYCGALHVETVRKKTRPVWCPLKEVGVNE
jgi:hypothetical protein